MAAKSKSIGAGWSIFVCSISQSASQSTEQRFSSVFFSFKCQKASAHWQNCNKTLNERWFMHLINISPMLLIFMENEEALVLFCSIKPKTDGLVSWRCNEIEWKTIKQNAQCVYTVHGYYTK